MLFAVSLEGERRKPGKAMKIEKRKGERPGLHMWPGNTIGGLQSFAFRLTRISPLFAFPLPDQLRNTIQGRAHYA